MFFILSKTFPFLFMPLTWVFILMILGFFIKKGRYKKRLLIAATAVLLFFTNTFIADEAMRLWEMPATKTSELRQYNTAVILGGMSGWDPQFKRVQFYQTNDRLMQGLLLYKTGKVKRLLVTSGAGKLGFPQEKEANFIRYYLGEVQLLDSNMIFESESRNTHENAVFSKPLLEKLGGRDTVLLITSANHMRRASACFSKLDIPHYCYVADRLVGNRRTELDHLIIPNAEALMRWNTLIRECVGMAMYWFQGWV